eukprot:12329217-Ditylum_brightwellii.AAC.1
MSPTASVSTKLIRELKNLQEEVQNLKSEILTNNRNATEMEEDDYLIAGVLNKSNDIFDISQQDVIEFEKSAWRDKNDSTNGRGKIVA